MKNQGRRTDYKNGVMKNQLWKGHYLKMVIKEQLSKTTKQLLPKKVVISKTGEAIVIVSNNYQKMVKTISNDHIRQTICTITKSPLALRTFSYVSIATINVPPTSFLFHYVANIIRCSFPSLFYPLFHSLQFVSSPLFVSFLVIVRWSASKEKAEKMLRGQSLKEVELDLEWEITPNKWNRREKYVVSIFGKKVIYTKMDKLHKWIAKRDVAWEK